MNPTLHIHFTGIRCGEFVKRQHDFSIALPAVMFDASDTSLAQYVLLVLSGGKMYREVDELRIDEDAIGLEITSDTAWPGAKIHTICN